MVDLFYTHSEHNLRTTPVFYKHGAITYKYPTDTWKFRSILFKPGILVLCVMPAAEIKAHYTYAISSPCHLDWTMTEPEKMQAGKIQHTTHFTNSHATCWKMLFLLVNNPVIPISTKASQLSPWKLLERLKMMKNDENTIWTKLWISLSSLILFPLLLSLTRGVVRQLI